MTTIFRRWLVLLAWLMAAGGAHAAYSCSISSPGFNRAYDATLAGVTTQQTYVTLTCSRAGGDSASMVYAIAADNGLNSLGINNRTALNGFYIRYDVYQDSTCTNQWKGGSTLNGTLQFGSNLTASVTIPYWGCMSANQTGMPAGVYSDMVTMTVKYGPNPQQSASNTFNVNIATPVTCSISRAPATLAFNYISYGAASTPSIDFTVTCTSYLPYTVSLDVASGTLLGLNYTLTLPTASVTGTGAAQQLFINGNMPAGQAGVCATGSCTGSTTHTLILTY